MTLKLDKRARLKLSERDIERQIIDALQAHGWRVLKTNKFCSGNAVVVQGAVEPGIPDLQARVIWRCVAPPDITIMRVIWIEIKRPGKDLDEKQKAWWTAHPDEEKRIARSVEDIKDLL